MNTATKTKVNGSDVEIPKAASITLKRIERSQIVVPIIGVSPLIVHRFDEKAKAQMLEAQQTTTRRKKEAKDPHACFMASRHFLADGADGFPAVAFKAAIVGAARVFDGVKMTELKQIISVWGEGEEMLVRLKAESPRMREDAVRLPSGVADLRYRAEFNPWSVDLTINYLPSMISAESIVALVDAAGLGGVGEWRPSKANTGIYGMFEVAS